ncbi:MAG TPA: DUF1361 domain-containing protein [Chitinophagaceae bacterium]|nr:DUF1361 domain-containing protein [Chitinophagaceae bacterium]
MSNFLRTINSKYFKEHKDITIILIVASLFATSLEFLRVIITGDKRFLYFIWNLFLAWIPYLIGMYLPIAYYTMRYKIFAYLLLIIWFLFWPNSPYIITDMLHLKQKKEVPLWYDLGMILSFAWAGLILGYISLIEIQNLVRKRIGRIAGWIFACIMLLLGALGIYIGRYGRLNSWDVINPDKLYSGLITHFTDEVLQIDMLGMTLMYAGFLLVGYITIKIIIKIPDRMAL